MQIFPIFFAGLFLFGKERHISRGKQEIKIVFPGTAAIAGQENRLGTKVK